MLLNWVDGKRDSWHEVLDGKVKLGSFGLVPTRLILFLLLFLWVFSFAGSLALLNGLISLIVASKLLLRILGGFLGFREFFVDSRVHLTFNIIGNHYLGVLGFWGLSKLFLRALNI